MKEGTLRVQSTHDSRVTQRSSKFPFFPKEETLDEDVDPDIFGEPQKTSAPIIDHHKKPSYKTDVWQMYTDKREVAEGLPPVPDDDIMNVKMHENVSAYAKRRARDLANLNDNYERPFEPEMVERGMHPDHTILYPVRPREDEKIPEPLRAGGYILDGNPIYHGIQVNPEGADRSLTWYQVQQYQDMGRHEQMYGAAMAAPNGVLGQHMFQHGELTREGQRKKGVLESLGAIVQRALFGANDEGTDRRLITQVRTGRDVRTEPIRMHAQYDRNGRVVAPEHYGTRDHNRRLKLSGPLIHKPDIADPNNPSRALGAVVDKNTVIKLKNKHSESYVPRKPTDVGLSIEQGQRTVPGEIVPQLTKLNRKLNMQGPLVNRGATIRSEVAGHLVPGQHTDYNPNRVIISNQPANRGAEEVGRFFHQWTGAKIEGTTKNQRSDSKIRITNSVNTRGQDTDLKVGQLPAEHFKIRPDVADMPVKPIPSATGDGHMPRGKDGMNIVLFKKDTRENDVDTRVGRIEEASGHSSIVDKSHLVARGRRGAGDGAIEVHKHRRMEVGAVAEDIHDSKPAPRRMKFNDESAAHEESATSTRKAKRSVRETTSSDLDKLEKLIEEA